MSRLATEHGGISAEYVALLALVIVIIAAIPYADIGAAVKGETEDLVCGIATDRDLRGGCGSDGERSGTAARDGDASRDGDGGRGLGAVGSGRAAHPATRALPVASASGEPRLCFAATGGCPTGPAGAIAGAGPEVPPEVEDEGSLAEALVGPPEGHWIVHDGKLVPVLENGIGSGAVRALGRVVGIGTKVLNGAKARAGRLGLPVGARGLLASERMARTQAAELQKLLPAVTRDKATMAVGVGRDKATGALRVVAGSSERGGVLRPAVEEATRKTGATVAKTPGKAHGEVRVLDYMKSNGIEPVTVGAGRPICPECAARIAKEGATAASRLRPPAKAPFRARRS